MDIFFYHILFWFLLLPADNFAVREPYDRVIRCLGFKVRLAFKSKNSRPHIQHIWPIDHFTVVCSVIGLWMAARLEVTLFWYRPYCFCCVNQVVLILTRCIYMRKPERSLSKQDHLQPRRHSKPGHRVGNCKMVYYWTACEPRGIINVANMKLPQTHE